MPVMVHLSLLSLRLLPTLLAIDDTGSHRSHCSPSGPHLQVLNFIQHILAIAVTACSCLTPSALDWDRPVGIFLPISAQRTVMASAAPGLFIALTGLSSASSLPTLYCWCTLLGVAVGAIYNVCITSAVQAFPGRRGLAAGEHYAPMVLAGLHCASMALVGCTVLQWRWLAALCFNSVGWLALCFSGVGCLAVVVPALVVPCA